MQSCVILPAAWRDPVEVLGVFADEPFAVGLLSGGDRDDARWSYIAQRPHKVLKIKVGDARDPFEDLRAFAQQPTSRLADGPPFQGGVIGLAAYELGARSEPVLLDRCGDWPDLVCGFYAAVLAFDHQARQVLAVGRGASRADAQAAAEKARLWLDVPPSSLGSSPLADSFTSQDGEAYEEAVSIVTAAIARGDFFQANIARRWRGTLAAGATPFDLVRKLGRTSPAPFAAYLRLEAQAVVSNSPERFLRLHRDQDQGWVETRPIKGTAPRGGDRASDLALAQALALSSKDRAENLMIVDLMRNDLARVCAPGAVQVEELFRVETFANVHHLVSTVRGRLAAGMDAADLLRAAFPPGSVTGAPKVQAMKTIAKLEAPRGPYCGSLFWLGCDGSLDSSVLIRTVTCEAYEDGWRIEARAGAGIVADSDPGSERRETEAKIRSIAEALA